MRYGLGVLALVAVVAGTLALADRQRTPVPKPRLALLTSLPLLFGEQFTLETPKNAAIARIERDFTIIPIATADTASLKGHTLLLMAHPRAQPAEVLVELDLWVSQGGRVIILADPSLEWEGSHPLGDPLRPPPDFADTGLLQHWGLRQSVDEAGMGSLKATDERCVVQERAQVARCRVSRGRAIVIADADFVMKQDEEASRRLELMMAELSSAETR